MQGFEDQKNQIDAKIKAGHFLQSKEWEEFQRSLGREVFRVDGALIIKLPLIAGKSYLYSAGIVGKEKLLEDFAAKENAVFLKFEPMTEDKTLAQELLRAGFVKSKKEIQPQRTVILDISKSEEELLGAMHGKARYNIKVAERHGVKISNYKTKTSDEFWGIFQKTSARDKFSTHTQEYYEKLLELPMTQLCTAEYRGKVVAAHVVLFYGDTAYYLHGASDYEYRNLMAPYLLHWKTMSYAREQGYSAYDFWGVDEKKWPGVTRFKRGFAGMEVEYVGSYDYVCEPFWYRLYSMRNFLKHYI